MAAPSRWHVASAPARPPRFPVALVALETKKLTLGFEQVSVWGVTLRLAVQRCLRLACAETLIKSASLL
jgi:hypothetical protein